MSYMHDPPDPPHPDDQPTAAPTDKVTAAAAGGALATVCLWLLQAVTDLEPAVGLEAAIATLFAVAFGYIKRESGSVATVR